MVNKSKILLFPFIDEVITQVKLGKKKKTLQLLAEFNVILNDLEDGDLRKNSIENIIEKIYLTFGLQKIVRPKGKSVKKLFSNNDKTLTGVSLVTCCMNRNENLLSSLKTWVLLDNINEIIIVDWSSIYPVYQYLIDNQCNLNKIKIIRVNNESKWFLSCAFNIGFCHTSYNTILKSDADIILKYNFFDRNKLEDNLFLAGDHSQAIKGQEYINGFFFIKKNYLMIVNGFNEAINSYGWDDDDLYQRLVLHGLKRKCVDLDSIYHIPHSNDARTNNSNSFDLDKKIMFSILTNKYLSELLPKWSSKTELSSFFITYYSSSFIEVERIVKKTASAPENVRREAEEKARLKLCC